MDEQQTGQPLTKKQRRAMRRQENERAQGATVRRRKVKRVIVWAVVALVVGGGVAGIVLSPKNARTSRPGQEFPQQSRTHIAEGASHDPYSTNPPTSGPHYGKTEVPGVYDKELEDERVIHSLEHGAVWITYKSSKVDQSAIDRLKEIAKPYKTKILLSPREKNDDPIAVVAWQHLLRLQTVDDSAVAQIKAFVKAFRNHGPENAPEETHR